MKKKVLIAIAACLICAVVFSGCSAGNVIDEILEENGVAEAEYWDDSYISDSDSAYYPEEEAWEGSASFSEDPLFDKDLIAGAPDGSKIVQTVYITLTSTDFENDYSKIKELLKNAGGYAESETVYGTVPSSIYDPGRNVYVRMRVPADKCEDFVDDISEIGNFISKEMDSEDYSDSYYDRESRINLLEERKDRLMGHLEKAEKMEDIIALEDEISEVIYELDELKGQQRGVDKAVEYATVTLDMTEYPIDGDVAVIDDGTLDPGKAFNSTLKGMGEFFRVLGFLLAAAAPVLILIAVILVVVFVIIRIVKNAKNSKK